MAILKWGEAGAKKFGVGVQNGVLYVRDNDGNYPKGVAWDGLTSVQESPSGAEGNKIYADNEVYGETTSKEEFGATVEAYWSPVEFDECDGIAAMESGLILGQQARKSFGLSYRTEIQDDLSDKAGYIIHCIYGCKAQPSERSHVTINGSVEAETLSWTLTTTPVKVTGFKPVSHVQIDSTKLTAAQMKAVEDALYGTTTEEAYLPLPDELSAIISAAKAQG